jgi:hypothetical protein
VPVTKPVLLHDPNTNIKLKHNTKSSTDRNKDNNSNSNNNNNNNNNFNLGNFSYRSVQSTLSSSLLSKNIKGKRHKEPKF